MDADKQSTLRTVRGKLSMSLRKVFLVSSLAVFITGTLETPLYGDDLQLNFAAVNQSPWTPGGATVFDNKFLLPDPELSGHLDLGRFNVDPTGAFLDFIGNLVGLDLGSIASVRLSPVGDFKAGLSASYHIDAGTVNLNYPEKVQLNLPTTVQAGQPFQVSAAFPGPISKLSFSPGQFAALGGSGYSGLSPLLHFQNSVYTPDRGFTTTFPYADAQLNLDLQASASIEARACLIFCGTGSIDLGSVNASTQIVDVNSLNGISVLGQNVLGYGTHNFDNTLALTVHPPDLSINGTERPDQTLAGSGNEKIIEASFDAASLIPIVGPFLAGSAGPIDYTLLSVDPGVSLGLYQNFSFTPNLMVNLDFSEPVREADGTVTEHVTFPVDGSPVTLTPATVGGFNDHTMQIKPTFTLDNTFHNTTGLTIGGDVAVTALQLSGLINAGPAFSADPDIFSIPIPLFQDSFQLDIPSISTPAVDVGRQSDFAQLFEVHVDGALDATGHGTFDLRSGDQVLATGITGQEVQVPRGLSNFCQLVDQSPFTTCDTVLVTDQNIIDGQGNNLGNVFCIACLETPVGLLPTSPSVAAGDGSSLFLSDLSTFPDAPTPDAIRGSDPVFGSSTFFQSFQITPADDVPGKVPEPGSVFLLGSGLLCIAGLKWRRLKG
jgi:hypothetical protein